MLPAAYFFGAKQTINSIRLGLALVAAAGLPAGCGNGENGQEAVSLPESLARPMEAGGTRFQALAYLDRRQAGQTFGFDILGSGLLPLRISIDNRGGSELKIIPRQTFLIDQDSQAWPLLTADQAFHRLEQTPSVRFNPPRIPKLEDLDSATGFALDLAPRKSFSPTPNAYAQPETRISKRISDKDLRNPSLPAGSVSSGVLFFPGRDEAKSASKLWLCYEQGGSTKFLLLPLSPIP